MAAAGSIEHLITAPSPSMPREVFTYLYRLINGYANTNVLASYYGFGGTGFDLTGGANPSGENAWFMWEWPSTVTSHGKPVLGLCQWCYAEALGVHGGPAAGYGNVGVFLAFACSDGGGFPWTGTTNNNGADTKGTPVWDGGVQNLVPFPRINSYGGTYATNREGMSPIIGFASPSRASFYVEENELHVYIDESNNGTYRLTIFSDIRSRIGHTVPLVMIADSLGSTGFSTALDYGDLTGLNFRQGGLAHPDAAQGTRTFRIDRHVFTTQAIHNPAVNGIYYAPRLALNLYDSQGLGSYGPAGAFGELREMYNVSTHTTFNGLTVAAYGGNIQGTQKVLCNLHDGATVPGTGGTAAGVQFGF
jgi:hypothetical protein